MKNTSNSLKKKSNKRSLKNEEQDKNQPSVKNFFIPAQSQPSTLHTNNKLTNHKLEETPTLKKAKGSNTVLDFMVKLDARNMSKDTRGTNLPGTNSEVQSSSSVVQGKKVKMMAAKFERGGSNTAAQIEEKYSTGNFIGRKMGKGGIGTNQGSC